MPASVPPDSNAATQLWIVDQIAEGWVSVEVDGARLERMPQWMFPEAIREGDVCRVTREPGQDRVLLTIVLDEEERDRRLEASQGQIARVTQTGNVGDIVL